MSDNSSLDLLGIKPVADSVNKTVNKTFEGLEGFLTSVCKPALDEVGQMLKDKMRYWRLNNILKIIEKSKGKLEFQGENLQIKAHPRVALSIIENGSVVDDEELQEFWAGLFATACTADGQDDENLIFVDLLKQLTRLQARILKYSCENSRKILYENGLISGDNLYVNLNNLISITQIQNLDRLDRELDHLRSLNLIGYNGGGGFATASRILMADISPTALSLNLYVKGMGTNKGILDYFKKDIITIEERRKEPEIDYDRIANIKMQEKQQQ